jgi:hypothetical protein
MGHYSRMSSHQLPIAVLGTRTPPVHTSLVDANVIIALRMMKFDVVAEEVP